MTFPSVPGNGIFFFYRINLFVARWLLLGSIVVKTVEYVNYFFKRIFEIWINIIHMYSGVEVDIEILLIFIVRLPLLCNILSEFFAKCASAPKHISYVEESFCTFNWKRRAKRKIFFFKYIWKPLQHFLLLFFGNWYLFDP